MSTAADDAVLAGSSPAGATAKDSPPSGAEAAPNDDASADSKSTATPEDRFASTIEQLEEGKGPAEAAKELEAETGAETKTADEPVSDPDKAKDNQAVSKADDVLTKAFDERPEWKKALSLVPKENVPAMRDLLRGVLTRENEVLGAIEKAKPAVETVTRLKTAVGNDDRAVEGAIVLAELHAKGDPRAREMLTALLNDLDSRTGSVLTSPDLVKRSKDIEGLVEAGTIDATEAQARKNDLLELERARAAERGVKRQTAEKTQAEQRQSFERQQADLNTTCNAWEQDKLKSDADYPSLKDVVEQRAFMVGSEQQSKLNGRLLNSGEMKKILDDSLTWAKEQAAKFKPALKVRSPLNGGGSSATHSRRAPASDAEAFEQEIERLEARRR